MCGSFKLIAKKFVYLIKSVCFHINFSLVFFSFNFSSQSSCKWFTRRRERKIRDKAFVSFVFLGKRKSVSATACDCFSKVCAILRTIYCVSACGKFQEPKKYHAEKQKWWQFLCGVWPKKRSRIKLANNLGYAMHINLYAVDGIQNGFVAHNDSYVRWIMLIFKRLMWILWRKKAIFLLSVCLLIFCAFVVHSWTSTKHLTNSIFTSTIRQLWIYILHIIVITPKKPSNFNRRWQFCLFYLFRDFSMN